MKTRMFTGRMLMLASFYLLGGCASGGTLSAVYNYTPYQSGSLQGEGLRIESEDGLFVIEEGRFTPPFQVNPSNAADSISWATYLDGTRPDRALIDSFDLALGEGAKKVRVYHPASEVPLYGVLLLNQRRADVASGPAARSYLIRVPDSYVNNAKGSRVSVVYEPVSFRGYPEGKMIGWALWLSDSPF